MQLVTFWGAPTPSQSFKSQISFPHGVWPPAPNPFQRLSFVVVAWAVDTVTVASLPVDPMLLRLLRLIKLFRLLRLIRTDRYSSQ